MLDDHYEVGWSAIIKTLTVVELKKKSVFYYIYEAQFGARVLGTTAGGKRADLAGRRNV
jgi:hypothetical protein